jgi:hypothetical protein
VKRYKWDGLGLREMHSLKLVGVSEMWALRKVHESRNAGLSRGIRQLATSVCRRMTYMLGRSRRRSYAGHQEL